MMLAGTMFLSACAETVRTSGDALVEGLRPLVLDLEEALLAHPETPEAVGVSGARLIAVFCSVAC